MARRKWSEEIIIRRIRSLERTGEDLTCSHVKEIDSALVGAAISYFGNWGAALEAAGLNYGDVRAVSRKRRAEKVRKWSIGKVLEEIRHLAETVEDDLSYAYMKEKYPTLVAAANNYVGSWKKAVEMLGYNYADVLRKGRARRKEREEVWRRRLLLERLSGMAQRDEKLVRETHPRFHRLLMKHFGAWEKVIESYRDNLKPTNGSG